MFHSGTRFAIIGAGPGGLSAALALRKKGYSNIEIFEKETAAGGKVNSYIYEGKPYELGAILLTANFHEVKKIADEFSIPMRNYHSPSLVDEDGKIYRFKDWTGANFSKLELIKATIRYVWLSVQEKTQMQVGLEAVPDSLTLTMDKYICMHKLEPLSHPMEPMMVGLGYGYFKEIPAAYIMKLFSLLFWAKLRKALTFGKTSLSTPVHGYQHLWQTVASSLAVHLNSPVEKIEKDGHCWKVKTVNGTKTFDQIILSVTPDISANLLPEIPQLARLAKEVRYYDYQVTVVKIDNFEREKTWYLRKNRQRDQLGQPIAITSPHPDANVYMVYTQTDKTINEDQILTNIKLTIQQMGGMVTEVLTHKKWRYFPHVSGKTIKSGFYEAWAGLQGRAGLWFTGGVFNFETVEHTIQYSNHLVNNMMTQQNHLNQSESKTLMLRKFSPSKGKGPVTHKIAK